MNYQRLFVGIAIGSAVAGLGFLLFHPSGKKLRRRAADIGLDAADKIIDMLRSSVKQTAMEADNEDSTFDTQRTRPSTQPVSQN
jgi:gas vesicle protein